MSDNLEKEKVTYNSYLRLHGPNLGGILECQTPFSEVPEEILFIVTHQAFELWFKVIKIDLDSACEFLNGKPLPGTDNWKGMHRLVTQLNRTCMILRLVVQHFEILETMSPMTFLEFRHLLKSGSGFQSVQFREIENKLGLSPEERMKHEGKDYKTFFETNEQEELKSSENEITLLAAVETWLASFHHLDEFWKHYCTGWKDWIEKTYPDRATNGDQKKSYEGMKKTFQTVQSRKEYEEHKYRPGTDPEKDSGSRRMSFEAFQGAMMISLYREEPSMHMAYQVLTYLKDIEALMTRWRTIHVMMVHRMIGNKPGTGGSTGVDYLKSTTTSPTRYRVFIDLFNLATYIIPMSHLPEFSAISPNEQ